MNTPLLLTTTVTIALAFVGYLVTYLNNLRLTQRAERLARVNKQLSEFYGPLFAMASIGEIAWTAFRTVYRPDSAYFDDGNNLPTESDLKAWRLWMSTVFMPLNTRMYELILSKADLLIETEMPNCLLELCAHIAAYQEVMTRWKDGDFSENTSLINFPSQSVLDYASKSFRQLKTEQERLIGHRRAKSVTDAEAQAFAQEFSESLAKVRHEVSMTKHQ